MSIETIVLITAVVVVGIAFCAITEIRGKKRQRLIDEQLLKAKQAVAKAEYHMKEIERCRKALDNASKVIYKWTDTLSNPDVDYSPLFDYLGKCLSIVERYVEENNLSIAAHQIDKNSLSKN